MANRYRPIKLTGEGIIEIREDGLFVESHEVRDPFRFLLVVLGFAIVCLVFYGLSMLGLSNRPASILGLIAAGAVVWPLWRRPAKESAEKVQHLFSWDRVREAVWDANSQCLCIIIRSGKPKGALYVVQAPGSELEIQLTHRLER